MTNIPSLPPQINFKYENTELGEPQMAPWRKSITPGHEHMPVRFKT